MSVKQLPRVAPADSAKQRAVLESVARLLERVMLQRSATLPLKHIWRLKSALRLIRSIKWPND